MQGEVVRHREGLHAGGQLEVVVDQERTAVDKALQRTAARPLAEGQDVAAEVEPSTRGAGGADRDGPTS